MTWFSELIWVGNYLLPRGLVIAATVAVVLVVWWLLIVLVKD